ncbi:phosphate acetyltransferase [bacterium]|nr:phosphate acetyltransferase [bacterium]
MKPIRSLEEMVAHVRILDRRRKLAVAMAEDSNTMGAVARAITEGIADAVMIGDESKIREIAVETNVDPSIFTIVDIPDGADAVKEAVRMVRSGEADVLMKGLVGTDVFLKGVLNKITGLMRPKSVMSYVCALEVPKYHKLLFVTDPAVLPFPDLGQKISMINYAVNMARKFGIVKPKVALISAAEKLSLHFQSHIDYALLTKMAHRGQIKNCTIDGPLDIFLACDKKSVEIKGVQTPVDGDADVLIFPTIESCNSFYKGLMLFAGGELGGLIQGTTKPVVMMSRSESPQSKFYCIACSCLMAE